MARDTSDKVFVFPRWTWVLRPGFAAAVAGGLAYAALVVWLGFSPRATDVGYAPEQPVPYSHALHVGQLGIDCRYCHNTVETAAHAAVPPTQTCMNCHAAIRKESEKLIPVRSSFATGMPIGWVRVHDLPDYVYFNHSAHVRRGVGCVECHGRVDKMEVVFQEQPLSMGWCLECHRDPDPRLRPVEEVTNMAWQPAEDRRVLGSRLREQYAIAPSEDCSTCHR